MNGYKILLKGDKRTDSRIIRLNIKQTTAFRVPEPSKKKAINKI